MKTKLILILFSVFVNSVRTNIHIWEPKSLRTIYENRRFLYNIVNFGTVPYGHSVYGTVFKAEPFDACQPLQPISLNKNYGTLIVLVKRSECHFS